MISTPEYVERKVWSVVERNEADYICHRLPRLTYTEVVSCAVDDHHRWYTVTGLVDHGQVGRVST